MNTDMHACGMKWGNYHSFWLSNNTYNEMQPSRFDGFDRTQKGGRRTKWSTIWTSGGYTSQTVMHLTKYGQLDYMGRILRLLRNSWFVMCSLDTHGT